MKVSRGQTSEFLQEVYVADHDEQHFAKLGQLEQRLVCTPDVEGIIGKDLSLIHVQVDFFCANVEREGCQRKISSLQTV